MILQEIGREVPGGGLIDVRAEVGGDIAFHLDTVVEELLSMEDLMEDYMSEARMDER
jgi:hypothetical protein